MDALPTVNPPADPEDPARLWWLPMPTRSSLALALRRALAGAVLLLLSAPAPRAPADRVAGSRTAGRGADRHGLRGEYFGSRRLRDDQRVLDRLDADVRFDFKDSSPEPDKIKPEEFAARWTGSVLAPETGDYEFI